MNENRFKKAEEEYFRLKGQLATGHITREQFDAAIKELMVQDAQGRYWMLGADSGKWFVHDGQNWVRADPPVSAVAGRPTLLPEQVMPPPAYPPPARAAPQGRMPPTWAFAVGGVILVLAVCACVALFALRGLPTTVSQIPPASLAPTSPVEVVTATETPRIFVVTATPTPFESPTLRSSLRPSRPNCFSRRNSRRRATPSRKASPT
jgi:hypothetical protein